MAAGVFRDFQQVHLIYLNVPVTGREKVPVARPNAGRCAMKIRTSVLSALTITLLASVAVLAQQINGVLGDRLKARGDVL